MSKSATMSNFITYIANIEGNTVKNFLSTQQEISEKRLKRILCIKHNVKVNQVSDINFQVGI